MATVKVKGVAGVKKNVTDLFNQVKSDPQTLKEIGDITVSLIVANTKSGKSVSTNSSFPSLSESTIEHRKYLARFNSTGELYDPGKSNLTLTGKLLQSISAVIFPSKGIVEVLPRGKHPGYKTGKGQTKSEDNTDIFEWLSKRGFKVFQFSQVFRDRLSSRVNVLIKRTLRKKILSNSK